jgi:hypothetical protein
VSHAQLFFVFIQDQAERHLVNDKVTIHMLICAMT